MTFLLIWLWLWSEHNDLDTQTWPRCIKMYMYTQKTFLASVAQKSEQTDKQATEQTYRQTHVHRSHWDYYYYFITCPFTRKVTTHLFCDQFTCVNLRMRQILSHDKVLWQNIRTTTFHLLLKIKLISRNSEGMTWIPWNPISPDDMLNLISQ